ncbi:hypothetical protein [Diplocloster modestus]|uniref:Histone H2A n=1 Tax=Diplocloster modestus TaxID=2850322 RepID=A0ABS6K1V2_9FIRM|nr:hypothetical protein [Diplocloster modestus]MBU9724447.1 hypothetical protein [Diplocloster modestus]
MWQNGYMAAALKGQPGRKAKPAQRGILDRKELKEILGLPVHKVPLAHLGKAELPGQLALKEILASAGVSGILGPGSLVHQLRQRSFRDRA